MRKTRIAFFLQNVAQVCRISKIWHFFVGKVQMHVGIVSFFFQKTYSRKKVVDFWATLCFFQNKKLPGKNSMHFFRKSYGNPSQVNTGRFLDLKFSKKSDFFSDIRIACRFCEKREKTRFLQSAVQVISWGGLFWVNFSCPSSFVQKVAKKQ